MPRFASPLRYPGGKEGLGRLLGRVIELNELQDCVYCEPYAGGAGAALRLLFGEYVSRVLINDLDHRVVSFWRSILDQTNQFLDLIDNTPVTLAEWQNQRAIYLKPQRHSRLRVGFAVFFLNRCNRSGILMGGGPIGGIKQRGPWKLDVRFYRDTLRQRIEKIAAYKERISVFNFDALDFLKTVVQPFTGKGSVFAYLDPPYYAKGKKLYLNAYSHNDHVTVARYLSAKRKFKWLLSYDNVHPIRRLYGEFRQFTVGLTHTAYERRAGRELLICRDNVVLPHRIRPWIEARNSV